MRYKDSSEKTIKGIGFFGFKLKKTDEPERQIF